MGKVAEAIARWPVSHERIERCSDLPLTIPRRWRKGGRYHVTAWNYYTDEGKPDFKVNEEMEFSEYIENVSGKFRSAVLIPVNNTEVGK